MYRKIGVSFGRRYRKQILLLGFIGLIIIIVIAIDTRIRPVVKTMSMYQGKVVATQIIDKVIDKELSAKTNSVNTYDDIIILERDEKNQVTSLEIDMIKANRFKARVTSEILKELTTLGQNEMQIPLGTFLGNEFFSGRGPNVSFKMVPSGYVATQFENHFESVGINQVLHQIILKVETNVTAIIPGYTSAAEVDTSFIVAQTVINGDVPDSFTQVEDGDTAKKIADYAPK